MPRAQVGTARLDNLDDVLRLLEEALRVQRQKESWSKNSTKLAEYGIIVGDREADGKRVGKLICSRDGRLEPHSMSILHAHCHSSTPDFQLKPPALLSFQ